LPLGPHECVQFLLHRPGELQRIGLILLIDIERDGRLAVIHDSSHCGVEPISIVPRSFRRTMPPLAVRSATPRTDSIEVKALLCKVR